jgi:hypothetical protein
MDPGRGATSGRVPHVRASVHGPKTDFFKCFYSIGRSLHLGNSKVGGAAPVLFSPCTLARTWGTRPGLLTFPAKLNRAKQPRRQCDQGDHQLQRTMHSDTDEAERQ